MSPSPVSTCHFHWPEGLGTASRSTAPLPWGAAAGRHESLRNLWFVLGSLCNEETSADNKTSKTKVINRKYKMLYVSTTVLDILMKSVFLLAMCIYLDTC